MQTTPIYLTEKQVAKIFNISVNTLQKHRQKGIGFPRHKICGSVRYRLDECENYAKSSKGEA